MKKVLFLLVVLLFILHPKYTLVQDSSHFDQTGIASKVIFSSLTNIPVNSFDLDDNGIDLADDNVNDSEKKYVSFHNVAHRTIYSVINPSYDLKSKSKGVAQNHFATASSLFILFRVLRV